MQYIKGYKFRMYPNKTLGCCRFVFNHFLNMRSETLKNEKKTVSYNDTSALMTQLKTDEEHLWLKEVDSIALQQSLRDFDVCRAIEHAVSLSG